MLEPTPLYGGNAEFLDALYEQYLRDPASVEERWRTYFTQLAPAEAAGAERAHSPIRAEIAQRAARAAGTPYPASLDGAATANQAKVSRLIQVWINRGHLVASIDPLSLMPRPKPRVLELPYYHLTPADLEVVDPVVEGSVRARQERCGDERGARVLPLLVHGEI